jgi:sulfur carrier protein
MSNTRRAAAQGEMLGRADPDGLAKKPAITIAVIKHCDQKRCDHKHCEKKKSIQSMQIYLNGEPLELDPNLSVQALIDQQGLSNRRLAVEVNQELVPRSQFSHSRLSEGDRVEIIHAVGGG